MCPTNFQQIFSIQQENFDVKQTFNPDGEFQHPAAQSGLCENEKLE